MKKMRWRRRRRRRRRRGRKLEEEQGVRKSALSLSLGRHLTFFAICQEVCSNLPGHERGQFAAIIKREKVCFVEIKLVPGFEAGKPFNLKQFKSGQLKTK